MKRILVTLFVFILVFFVTDRIFIHYFTNSIFNNILSGESGGSLNFLLNRKKNSDFLVLGSSRAKHQIDPEHLTDVYSGNGYNAGINGVGTVVYNSILLEILIRNSVIPKVIILQTDAYQFSDNGTNFENEISPLYPFIEQSTLLNSYVNYREHIKLCIHSYRFNGKFLNILYNYFKRNSILDNTGFIGLKVNMDSIALFRQPAKALPRFVIADSKINALKNIVTLCNRNNIELIVVVPPFYRNLSFNSEGNKRLFKVMREIGVTNLLDLSDVRDLPGLMPASMWKDKDHLNNEGAIIFSKTINERLRQLSR